MEKQRTLKETIVFNGVGLHTGDAVRMEICPAPENHGYKFQRVDVEGEPIIKADCDLVVATDRGTTLEDKGVRVYTTEHVLAALYGMQVDNALIKINGPEIPIMDGSSMLFVEEIERVGYEDQNADRDYFELTENIPWEDTEKGIEFLAVPDKNYRVTVMVDYKSPVLGTQHASMYQLSDFKKEVSTCRTFCFLGELEFLAKNNLIKGGSLDNAIVLVERNDVSDAELDHLAKVLGKEKLSVNYDGIGVLNSLKLKFENEPARHKLLDIVGDLALVGKPMKIHVLAARPGHAGNVDFAKKLKALAKIQKNEKDYPKIDMNKPPVLNIMDIMKLLPHRQPMLLVDKIMEISEQHVIGVKNVTLNEEFFKGHFPDNPVMPGVLLIEAMAQCGGVLVLKTVPDPENYLTYFIKIDDVKFKQKVIPGDTVVFSLQLVTPIRRGICHMKGVAYVNNKPVMEGEMMAQIVKVKGNEVKTTEAQLA